MLTEKFLRNATVGSEVKVRYGGETYVTDTMGQGSKYQAKHFLSLFFLLLFLFCVTNFDCIQYFKFIFTNFFPSISDCLLELEMQQNDHEMANVLHSSMD